MQNLIDAIWAESRYLEIANEFGTVKHLEYDKDVYVWLKYKSLQPLLTRLDIKYAEVMVGWIRSGRSNLFGVIVRKTDMPILLAFLNEAFKRYKYLAYRDLYEEHKNRN